MCSDVRFKGQPCLFGILAHLHSLPDRRIFGGFDAEG
jgi:hypothetical protein